MATIRHGISGRAQGVRQLSALVVIAWLQLLLQPALAQGPAMPADMDCHHAGDCPAMLSAACAADQLFVAATGHAPHTLHVAPLISVVAADALLADSTAAHRAATLQPPATGPPLIIRFGHLRN